MRIASSSSSLLKSLTCSKSSSRGLTTWVPEMPLVLLGGRLNEERSIEGNPFEDVGLVGRRFMERSNAGGARGGGSEERGAGEAHEEIACDESPLCDDCPAETWDVDFESCAIVRRFFGVGVGPGGGGACAAIPLSVRLLATGIWSLKALLAAYGDGFSVNRRSFVARVLHDSIE